MKDISTVKSHNLRCYKIAIMIIFILSIIAFFVIFFLFYLSNSYISKKDFSFEKYEFTYPIYFQKEDLKLDKESYSNILKDEVFDKLPEDIVNSFYQEGGQIFICERKFFDLIRESHEDYKVASFYIRCYGKPRIYISKSNDDSHHLLHELGHYYDDYYGGLGYISKSKEFQLLIDKEFQSSSCSYNDYYRKPNEFFAEQFACYFSRNEIIKETNHCPETYDFIERKVYNKK